MKSQKKVSVIWIIWQHICLDFTSCSYYYQFILHSLVCVFFSVSCFLFFDLENGAQLPGSTFLSHIMVEHHQLLSLAQILFDLGEEILLYRFMFLFLFLFKFIWNVFFSICACHPCVGTILFFFVSSQFYQMSSKRQFIWNVDWLNILKENNVQKKGSRQRTKIKSKSHNK